MRTVVAVVAARPETIAEDYRRLLDLAGVPAEPEAGGPLTLAVQAGPGGWTPGEGCPPWQVDGVLGRLAEALPGPGTARVAAVDPAGGPGRGGGWGWDRILASRRAAAAEASFWTVRPWRPHAFLPGLGAALPADFGIPAGLTRGGILGILAVPALDPAWTVAGATRLALALAPGRVKRPRRMPPADFRAESLNLLREVLATSGTRTFAVLDGAIWQVGRGHRGRGPVDRNVLVASADPVAADAVAVRMSGADPARVPWLRACTEGGLGTGDPRRIRLAGQADLVERAFERPDPRTLAAGWGAPLVDDLSWRFLRRPAILRRHRATPWGRLFEEYRRGGQRGTRDDT